MSGTSSFFSCIAKDLPFVTINSTTYTCSRHPQIEITKNALWIDKPKLLNQLQNCSVREWKLIIVIKHQRTIKWWVLISRLYCVINNMPVVSNISSTMTPSNAWEVGNQLNNPWEVVLLQNQKAIQCYFVIIKTKFNIAHKPCPHSCHARHRSYIRTTFHTISKESGVADWSDGMVPQWTHCMLDTETFQQNRTASASRDSMDRHHCTRSL